MTVYQEEGYENRADYLESLAKEHGVPYGVVWGMAAVLGPDEDFDGLVTEVEDYAIRVRGRRTDDD